MTRAVARTALALAAALFLLGALAAPSSAQSDPSTTTTTSDPSETGPPETPSGDPAIDDLVGCIQGSQRLLVLFLIDESASLKESDPENRRVDAARGALDSLVALATSEGEGSPQVDVALAAFSNEFRMVNDWTTATTDTAGSLDDSLSQFAELNNGIDTDLVNALSAGRESLADQAAELAADGGEPPCRAVMLFTDGGYDLAVRTTKEQQDELGLEKPYAPNVELINQANVEAAERLGRQELCEPGGLADQIRADDVTMLTVALSGDVPRRIQVPLAAATTGIADGYPCGTQPKDGEETRPQGAYLPAEDIDVLVTQFNGVGARLAGGSIVPGEDQVEICDEEPCAEGTRDFTLDGTLRRAQVLALAPAPGVEVHLTSPAGETATLSKAGDTKVGDVAVSTRDIAGRGYAIDLERPADAAQWNGKWSVSLVDPSGKQAGEKATVQVYVFSDIGVDLGELLPLQRGEPSAVTAVLQLPEGVEAADIVADATAVARFRNPVTGAISTVDLEGPPEGPYTGTFNTPEGTRANALEVIAEVRITTKGGAELVSQSPSREVSVRRPEGSIQFAPGSLQMPPLTGEGSTETDFVMVGGPTAGCVWFGKVTVAGKPDGIGAVTLTIDGKPLPAESTCIKIPAGQAVTVSVEASPEGRGSGTVAGQVVVFEKVDGGTATETDLVFRFDMARGIDQARRLFLAVLLLLLGLGLPMLGLLLMNILSARFQQLDAVRAAALPARVNNRSILRTDGGRPRAFTLRDSDFGSLATAGDERSFVFGGIEFRARASRNPFGAMKAMAQPVSGAEKLKGSIGSQVELDAGLAGSWVFLLDPDLTRKGSIGDAAGLLIVFIAEGDTRTQIDRMMPDINDRLPSMANTMAGLVRSSAPKPSRKARAAQAAAADDAVSDEAADPPPPPASADPAPSAPDPEPAPAPETSDDAPPDAPVGFGGRASVDPRTAPPPPPSPPADTDGPTDPPIGFSGR